MVFGIGAAAIVTYTTRHFINGDAINYIEMGEALRYGRWGDLINLTESPGYAVLLGIGQFVLDTTRANEIPLLKSVNFGCFIAATLSCMLFLASLRKVVGRQHRETESSIRWTAVSAACCAMFVFCALTWIKPRLIAPEMAVFTLVLLSATVLIRIYHNPRPYGWFVALGGLCGISYFFKTFFFPYTVIYFAAAGLACRSVRIAIPRTIVGVAFMAVISLPFVSALSSKCGRFTYGEAGKLTYKLYVDARGSSVHKPTAIHESPRVLLYRNNPFVNSTRPACFDPGYWKLGIEPAFNIMQHMKLIVSHVGQIVGDRIVLTVAVVLWLLVQIYAGAIRVRFPQKISIPMIFGLLGCSAVGMYSLIHLEMRYVAPFLFLLFTALMVLPLHFDGRESTWKLGASATVALTVLLLVLIVGSTADQSFRGLRSTDEKPSYREAYGHLVGLRDYLFDHGVTPGSDVAVVGFPPIYWARMAGVRIIAEIPEPHQLSVASNTQRMKAVEALAYVGIRALVGKGKAFGELREEGWAKVPGTRDYFVRLSDPDPARVRQAQNKDIQRATSSMRR